MDGESIDTGTDLVRARVTDRVGVITLNRPERRNALAPAMFDAIDNLLARYAADPGIGAVLLTGSGGAFSAGGDVQAGSQRAVASTKPSVEQRVDALLHDSRITRMLYEHPQITVAALPGPAVGAGLSLALACDFRIAAERATLVTGWGRLGLSGDFGGSWLLTRLLGPSRALELLVDGTPLSAPDALALGLLNRVVPDAEVEAASLGWARRIARGPITAQRYMKANVRAAVRLDLDAALAIEAEHMIRTTRTSEHTDAVRAWMEQRSARLSGVNADGRQTD